MARHAFVAGLQLTSAIAAVVAAAIAVVAAVALRRPVTARPPTHRRRTDVAGAARAPGVTCAG